MTIHADPTPPDDPEVRARNKALSMALQFTGTTHGNSRWTAYHRCPREHYLRYREGLRLIEQPDYFAIGNLLHAGLCYAALGVIDEFRWKLSDLLEEAVARRLFTPEASLEGSRLLKSYFGYWGTDNAGYGDGVDVIEAEHLVSTNLSVPYTSRLDAVLEVKGDLVIVDHKTRASMPGDTDRQLARRWRTRPQFLGSAYALREIEGETPGFIVNVISKTMIPKFRRVAWRYRDDELDRWAEEFSDGLKNGTEETYMNYQSCAPDIGAPCWAFDWCHGTDEDRVRLYEIRRR